MKVIVGIALAALATANPQRPLTPSEPPPPLSPAPSSASMALATTQTGPPLPTVTGNGEGPICECGYTYCASVLVAMKKPWNQKQLTAAYCSTPNVACLNGKPATNVTEALYVCLCDTIGQHLGSHLDLLCGCETCMNIGPDYRGRCETPCYPGPCKLLE